jgi:hypothetical protein
VPDAANHRTAGTTAVAIKKRDHGHLTACNRDMDHLLSVFRL